MSNTDNQPQLTQSEYESILKEETEKYNAEIEKYNEEKDELYAIEKENHSLLRKIYRNLRNGKEYDTDLYEQSCVLLEDTRSNIFDRQGRCLVLLQKVRNLQNNYLVSLINGLQAQLKEAKGEKMASQNQHRQNNLY